jgi:cytochrome c
MRKPLFLALAMLASAAHGAGDADAGRVQFERVCADCHQIGPSARNGFGPHLNGIFGRHAGSVPGYNYSPAMKAVAIVWTPEKLSAFIHDPDEVVPDTKMGFWGIGDEQKIADLLAYLKLYQ